MLKSACMAALGMQKVICMSQRKGFGHGPLVLTLECLTLCSRGRVGSSCASQYEANALDDSPLNA